LEHPISHFCSTIQKNHRQNLADQNVFIVVSSVFTAYLPMFVEVKDDSGDKFLIAGLAPVMHTVGSNATQNFPVV
jgi:hypothetical protein